MGEEIIKILEYLKNSDAVKVFAIEYVITGIIGIIIFILVIITFIISLRRILKGIKEDGEK